MLQQRAGGRRERERVREEEVLLGAGGWSWTSVEERPSRLEDLF